MKGDFISLLNDHRFFPFTVQYPNYISPWLCLNFSLSGVFGQLLSKEVKQNNPSPTEGIPILQ